MVITDHPSVLDLQQTICLVKKNEVGDRLTHGKHDLMDIQCSGKERFQHLSGGTRLFTQRSELIESLLVVNLDLANSLTQAVKREPVRGQNKGLVGKD
jgi:hypothetical protein